MKKNQKMIENVMGHRLKWLNEWLSIRNYDIGEARMDFLCICYCSLRAFMNPAKAQEEMQAINSSLKNPFSEDKLHKHIFYKIDVKEEVLRYTNKKIKEILKITDEEYLLLNPDCHKRQVIERNARTGKRNALTESIITYYEKGYSRKEIAGLANCNASKVDRVLRKVSLRKKEERNQKIWILHEAGRNNTEIAKLLGCNRDTVGAVLRSRVDAEKSTLLNIPSCCDGKSVLPRSDDTLRKPDFLFSLYKLVSEDVGEGQPTPSEILATTKENILLQGPAGTGKSYSIQQYLMSLSEQQKRKILIVAPTWKAATQLNGITIHRAFELSTEVQNTEAITKIPKALKGIETIIIDEISMLRIDVFNKMMQTIRFIENEEKRTIRIIAVGDFGQLPPIATEEDTKKINSNYPDAKNLYCFSSKMWESLHFRKINLYHVYRQENKAFSEALTKLKYGCVDAIDWFNTHCSKGFNKDAITIVPTNELVKKYNDEIQQKLFNNKIQYYQADYTGALTSELPAPETISLANNCRIMVLHNGKTYKNGQLGTVVSIEKASLKVRLDDTPDKIVTIPKKTWVLNNGTDYTQFPVCLGYAITVNKSQGATFNMVNIDRGNGFWLPGQLYVALSRCKTAQGIYLVSELKEQDLHIDEQALNITLK